MWLCNIHIWQYLVTVTHTPCMESVSWRRRRAGKTKVVILLIPLPLIEMSHISGAMTVFPINCLLWIVCGVVVGKYCMSIDYFTADHVIWILIMVQMIRLYEYWSLYSCLYFMSIESIDNFTNDHVIWVLIILQIIMLYEYCSLCSWECNMTIDHFTNDHVIWVLNILLLIMLCEYWSLYSWSFYMSIDHCTADHVIWELIIVKLIMLYEYW